MNEEFKIINDNAPQGNDFELTQEEWFEKIQNWDKHTYKDIECLENVHCLQSLFRPFGIDFTPCYVKGDSRTRAITEFNCRYYFEDVRRAGGLLKIHAKPKDKKVS